MIILDTIIAIMLVVSIVYSWRLNRKMIDLRSSRNDLTDLMKVLDNTILRADAGIEELRSLSYGVSSSLNSKVEKAKALTDELLYMTDRANIVVDKLEGLIRVTRKIEKNHFSFAEDLSKIDAITSSVKQKDDSQISQNDVSNISTDDKREGMDMSLLKEQLLGDEGEKRKAIESLLNRISVSKKDVDYVSTNT